MAAAQLPTNIEPSAGNRLRQAINESFVDAFRQIMLIGSALAFASALSGWILIEGKPGTINIPRN